MIHSLDIGGIDKVAACVEVGIEQLEAALLVHRAEPNVRPLVTDAHGTELDGRDVDASERSESPVATELGLGLWGRKPYS